MLPGVTDKSSSCGNRSSQKSPHLCANFIGNGHAHWLTRRVSQPKHNVAIAGSLLFVVFLWGGNNAGTKWLVASWPPIWTGGIRFLLAGLLLLAVLRFTSWLGEYRPLTSGLRRQLWLRGGLSLAVYIVVFNWALRLTAASHVALYIGASPVWTLLWEERLQRSEWIVAEARLMPKTPLSGSPRSLLAGREWPAATFA
jgi:hypothetical protein